MASEKRVRPAALSTESTARKNDRMRKGTGEKGVKELTYLELRNSSKESRLVWERLEGRRLQEIA